MNTTTTRTRFRGEKGIAVIMTALCLLPLMAFAAFGVDLASFYSRASYLQKSADAAALAGTVWMPNLTKARQIACDSLLNNNIDGGDCGTGTFNVTVARVLHRRPRSSSPSPTPRHQVLLPGLRHGDQALTRPPKPSTTSPSPSAAPSTTSAATPPRPTHRRRPRRVSRRAGPPTTPSAPVTRHAATSAPPGPGLRRSGSTGHFNPTGFSGTTRCEWTVRGSPTSGTTTTRPRTTTA